MITIVAISVLSISTLLVLGNLRAVSHDTTQALTSAAQRFRQTGDIRPRLAFVMLWVMIFALSYV